MGVEEVQSTNYASWEYGVGHAQLPCLRIDADNAHQPWGWWPQSQEEESIVSMGLWKDKIKM